MSASIERVAQSTGFRDPEWMRRAFGQPPQSLRCAARRGRGQHRLPGQTKQTIIGFSRPAR